MSSLDILKETAKSHRDNEHLSRAIASLKVVMTHINEDKRKTENRIAMLEIMNNIENCPVIIVLSHKEIIILKIFFFIKGYFALVTS